MKKGWGVERTLTTPLKGSVAPDAGEDSADPLTERCLRDFDDLFGRCYGRPFLERIDGRGLRSLLRRELPSFRFYDTPMAVAELSCEGHSGSIHVMVINLLRLAGEIPILVLSPRIVVQLKDVMLQGGMHNLMELLHLGYSIGDTVRSLQCFRDIG